MINYLALLGWNDGTDKDIYTRAELIQASRGVGLSGWGGGG